MKLAAGKQIYLASETRKHSEKNNATALGGGTQQVDAVVTADGVSSCEGTRKAEQVSFESQYSLLRSSCIISIARKTQLEFKAGPW